MICFFLLQLMAHILADFIFQTRKMCRIKGLKYYSKAHLLHVLIVFVLSWTLSFRLNFLLFALTITATHFIIDIVKTYFVRRKHSDMFFMDQFLHVLIIFLASYIFINIQGNVLQLPFEAMNCKNIAIALGYVFVTKPVNILIREIFRIAKIEIPTGGKKNPEGVINAGRLIGIVERILTITFVLLGSYQIIGFIIAAKSLLRFKDSDRINPEYVLIGTLLSFGIAIMTGVGIGLIS